MLVVFLTPAVASAHISLTSPSVRTIDQKVGPCGATGSVRGTNVTVYAPGQMVEVRWTEPVNHPSHYRISFDAEGQDFTVPADFMDFTKTENVLADNIADGASPFTRMVQLPNIACENCTLQLTQMMYDKAPYGDGNDLYFQCADIALRAGGAPPTPDPQDPPGSDGGIDPAPVDDSANISGGCSAGGGGGALQAIGFASVLGALGRRSRRRR